MNNLYITLQLKSAQFITMNFCVWNFSLLKWNVSEIRTKIGNENKKKTCQHDQNQ